MADVVFNIALGEVKKYAKLDGGANDALIVVLLKSSGIEADATIRDHDDLAALLAAANDEADFTNYARKTITSATITVDDTNNRVDIDIADQTWTSAGGAANNTLAALLVNYDPDTTAGTDSTVVPLTKHDFSVTTDGIRPHGTDRRSRVLQGVVMGEAPLSTQNGFKEKLRSLSFPRKTGQSERKVEVVDGRKVSETVKHWDDHVDTIVYPDVIRRGTKVHHTGKKKGEVAEITEMDRKTRKEKYGDGIY